MQVIDLTKRDLKDDVVIYSYNEKNPGWDLKVGKPQAIAYNMWWDGNLYRGYIYAPVRMKRKLGVSEYSARIDKDGKSHYGVCRQDVEGKLYLVKN